MTVTVVNHSKTGIEVHKVGCADIEKSRKKRLVNSDWPVTIPDGADVGIAVVADLNDGFGWDATSDEPAPWSTNDIRVFPCVKG
jgi:hypothetical protein